MRARVRRALPRDLPALARLCRAAAGADDYVLAYLDEMVRAGQILAVQAGRRLVAMLGVTTCLDGALWLGQARTHPAFRRRGYARMLVEATIAHAAREGVPALRLWVSARNRASQRLAEAAGFRRVAVFSRLVAGTLPGAGNVTAVLPPEEVYRRWRRSVLCRAGQAYLAYRGHFLPPSATSLQQIAGRGELLVGPRAAFILWAGEPGVTYASVLWGGIEALRVARRAARSDIVAVFLPYDRHLLIRAKQAGYRSGSWGRRAVLYERSV
ncbi:MAG: GNAT family N-acetyltransferase [Armatimonadota bacterium]|nr:GNAT family N-acetyltransferase [Armatimonadota bacterium]MDR7465181.1 GNAT family N-acetyltransferase [Armatimonadota bacterium]